VAISVMALDLLDRVEALEIRSLEWGFADGSLSERETEALAQRAAGGAVSADDIL
jgi:hypothetical protein